MARLLSLPDPPCPTPHDVTRVPDVFWIDNKCWTHGTESVGSVVQNCLWLIPELARVVLRSPIDHDVAWIAHDASYLHMVHQKYAWCGFGVLALLQSRHESWAFAGHQVTFLARDAHSVLMMHHACTWEVFPDALRELIINLEHIERVLYRQLKQPIVKIRTKFPLVLSSCGLR